MEPVAATSVRRVGEPDDRLLWAPDREAPQAGGREVAEGGGRPAKGEQNRQAVELIAPSLRVGAPEVVGRDVDPPSQPLPATRRAQVPDLGVLLPRTVRVEGGEDPALAFGGGAQQRVHARSLICGGRSRPSPVDDAARSAPW